VDAAWWNRDEFTWNVISWERWAARRALGP
jgi:hypothetical protein